MGIFNNKRDQDVAAFDDNQYATQRDAVKDFSTETLKNLQSTSPEGQRAVREELESRES